MAEDRTVRQGPLTQTVRLEQAQLEQLQRSASLGAVASSVAHEFNNILTTILNHAKLGMHVDDLDSKQRSFEKILTAARRAAKVTSGMLSLSRSRSSTVAPAEMVQVVEEVLSVLEKDLSKHRIRVERDYRDQPTAEVVHSQIEQVLMNLIINARQAMPRGGVVRVSVRLAPEKDAVEISIRDNGIGIEPDKLGKIFEPFFSTKQAPDEQGHGGSGLGLSICREIIERHHGRIRVESQVGRGTCFTLRLPLAQPRAVPRAA